MDPTGLDDVRSELAAIHEELFELPADDFTRRVELQDRRNEMRALSRDMAGELPPAARDALVAEFERLSRARDRILKLRLMHHPESVGDAGLSSAFTDAVNSAIESGLGLDEIQRQIHSILEQLDRPSP